MVDYFYPSYVLDHSGPGILLFYAFILQMCYITFKAPAMYIVKKLTFDQINLYESDDIYIEDLEPYFASLTPA